MKTRNFIPVYLLEIVMTFVAGVTSTALSNYLIRDLLLEPWLASLISSAFFLGFLISTILIGHISDKYGPKKVLKVILTAKIVFNSYYIIPITSDLQLLLLGIVYLLDGAFNGMFWPTVQHLSVAAENKGGNKLKNNFLAGYNISWNLGFLFGSSAGTIFLYFTNSNLQALIMPIVAIIIGNIVAWKFLNITFVPLYQLQREDGEENNKDKENNKNTSSIRESGSKSINNKILFLPSQSKLVSFPFYTILMILLIHSLIDGAILIILPLKIKEEDFWIFLLVLLKIFAQMLSTIKFSYIKHEKIILYNAISIFGVTFSWLLMLFAENLILIMLLLIISGTFQGAIYSLNMKITSLKAKQQQTSKPFSYFQSMMSSGRLLGPILIGFGTLISTDFGLIFLLLYDIVSIFNFIYCKGKYL
ncbi:MAG: MFS transporter [Promethearchaeota archaeon]